MTRNLDRLAQNGNGSGARRMTARPSMHPQQPGGKCGPTARGRRTTGTWEPPRLTLRGRSQGGCSLVSRDGGMTQEANALSLEPDLVVVDELDWRQVPRALEMAAVHSLRW